MCNRAAQCVDLHVVREAAPAVDLDNRQPLPVGGLELGVARDVDLAQVEAELGSQRAHLCKRPLAQVATLRVEDDDLSR